MPALATRKIDLGDKRLTTLRREFAFKRDAIDKDKRTVQLAFASETPVERYFGNEILDCTAQGCDLSRLNDGAALLWMHDPSKVLGVVESASMEMDKTGRAMVRFGRSAEAEQYFQDVQDGILRKVSVGYRVQDMVLESSSDDGGDTYRVTRWQPMEISLVSIPADSSVGVGRSHETPGDDGTKTNKIISTVETTTATTPSAEVQAQINAATGKEANRVAEILAISDKCKVKAERRDQAIKDKEPVEAFQRYVLEEVLSAKPVPVQSENIGLDAKDKKRYSILRAFNLLAEGKPLDGLEGAASAAAAKQYKREIPGMGMIIPHDMSAYSSLDMAQALSRVNPGFRTQMRAAVMEASIFSQGGAFVQTDLLGGSLIELLRNKTLLNSLGTVNLTGLVGNVAIPKQTGPATAYWLDETTAVTETNQLVGQLALTPKRLSAATPYTKQFLAQSSIDAEAFVRDDLMRVMAIAKDLAGIAGTGGGQPLGITNTPNIGTVSFGGAATWAKILEFETDVMTANADLGAMNFLTNITVRNKWKQIAQIGTTFPVWLVDPATNKANGYPVNVTNQVPTSATAPFSVANQVIFGSFNQLISADWAGMDVVVDPYTLARQNQVRITLCIFTDIGVRHAQSFAISSDSGAQ